MDDRAELARQLAGLAHRFVGYREAGVQPDQSANQRRGGDASAFRQAASRLVAAEIALARAVAEQRAHAELFASLGEDRQRPFDQVRRFVMVDQRRRAGEQRPGDIVARSGARGFRASSARSRRHHTFSRISRKSARRRIGRRHAVARQAAVEMGVGADRAGLDLAVGARQARRAGRRGGDDAPVDDRHAAAA